MNTRREFLTTTSLASLAPMLPSVFAQSARAATASSEQRVLVVIQLSGGNDGINTALPFADDGYAKARNKLRQETKELHKLDDRVVVLAFSEFGRRVAENVSAGTDHGSAGPVFLAGTSVRGGLIGATPDLTDLVNGDLKTSIDFRQVYATILNKWLDVAPEEVMNAGHKQLNMFS